ncbi:MAG: methylated-DNA--[protein]-cysteine S-methyltransferase [Polyangiales bacterium]
MSRIERGRGALVETKAGPIGIGWTTRGLARVAVSDLSHDDEGVTSRREVQASLAARERDLARALDQSGFPVRNEIDGAGVEWALRIARHVEGHVVDYSDLTLDLGDTTEFARRVYATAQRIPRGETWTYQQLGAALGTASGASAMRAVGTAMAKNPIAIVVPCHRVVSSDATGGLGGYGAPGGLSTKAALLVAEGGRLDDAEHARARKHLGKMDPDLAPFVRRRACTLPVAPRGDLFRTLARSITGQQLSTKAAATIFGRLETHLFGLLAADDPRRTRWPHEAAPALAHTPIPALRAVGFSEAKARSLVDLAEKTLHGALDFEALLRAPDRAVIESLTAIRGVGRWTVQMILMFELGRPDVLPTADLGIRNGVKKVYRMRKDPTPAQMILRAEAWRPFRSIGSWYLWRALENAPVT